LVDVSTNGNALSATWGNFLDLNEDLKPWLRYRTGASSDDVLLQDVLDMACSWVQDYLSRPIGPTRFDRRFNGWSSWQGAYIMLPYQPVLEILSVTEYWGVSGPHVLEESQPTDQLDGFQCEYLRGMVTRVFPGNVQKPWFPGSRNIEISWVAGFNPVPAYVRIATLEYAKYWWTNTQQASRSNPRGGGEYDAPDSRGLWPGVPNRITDLLQPLLQVGIG
jgi:hypothetical protein